LHPRERPHRHGRQRQGAARERGRQRVLPRHRRGQAQIVPQRQALQAPQALARVIERGEAMSEFYNALETRDPAAREKEIFARLSEAIARAMSSPGWAEHLKGVDPKAVTSRAALAKLPVLRKADLPAMQKAMPPFGGLALTPPGKLKRLLMSPGPIFEPEGHDADAAGA